MSMKRECTKQRRICILCQTWESGGIESFIHSVLHHMDITHFSVDLVVEELRKSVFTESLKQIGIEFFELSGSTHCLYKNYKQFAALIKQRRYDVLHLNVFQAQAMMYLGLAAEKGIPIRIVHSHNNMLRPSIMRPFKMLIHRTLRKLFTKTATDWWACSEVAARFMFTNQIVRNNMWSFIPNGIELIKFRFDANERDRIRKELRLENCFVIGNIGRLCYQKNQTFLLKVFAEIRGNVPKSKLLFIGEGEDERKLREQAKCLGLTDDVIFFGVSEHVEQLLWAMDVFTFPSHFEAFGIAVIEAQAAGLPVICSDNIPKEVMVSERVKCLSLNDKAAWIFEIMNKKKEYKRNIYELGLCKYEIGNVSDQIAEQYLQSFT